MNAIPWSNKSRHEDLFHFVCGLIRLRRIHPAFRLRSAEEVATRLTFLPTPVNTLIAYRLREEGEGRHARFLYLFFNASPHVAHVSVPFSDYRVLCRNGKVAVEGLEEVRGGSFEVVSRTALILEHTSGHVFVEK